MKKQMLAAALALALSGSVFVGIKAQTNIVDSMVFQGAGVELTLNAAIEQMLKSNPDLEKLKLDIENIDVQYDKLKSAARSAKRNPDAKEGTAVYIQSVMIPDLTADFQKENAQRIYNDKVNELKISLEQSYFTLLQAQEGKAIAEENVKTLKDLYEKTQKKFELGFVTERDVLSSKSSYIQAQNRLALAEDGIKNAKMGLNLILNNEIMTELKLKETLSYKKFQEMSIAAAVSKALENSTAIKGARFEYEIEKLNMDVIAKKYPEIVYDYKEQKIKLQKAEKSLSDAQKGIEMAVRSSYLDILQKQNAIKATEESITLAKKILTTAKTSYDLGMSLVTDVEQAQTNLQNEQLNLSRSILEYNLAILKFEKLIGSTK